MGRPTSRSLDKNRQREALSAMATPNESSPLPHASKRKGGSRAARSITRSRTGCISCRVRKKKCDEAWPQCGDCKRLNRACSGPVGASKKALEKIEPGYLSLDSPVLSDSERNSLALPGIDGDISTTDLLNQEMQIVRDSSEFWQSPLTRPLSTGQIDTTEKELLSYFKDVVVPILFMRQRLDKVSEAVLPLCFQYKQVRYPILGIAAAHRAGRDPGYFLDYMCYKDKAQKSAEMALKSQTEESMLSLLMMVYLEVLDGLSTNWGYYLENVFQRMNNNTENTLSSGMFAFIKQTFYYLDFVSSLSTCNPPFAARNKANPHDQYVPESTPVRLGLCGELGSILGDISTLSSMRSLRSQHFILEDQFNSFAEFIELRLNRLTFPTESSPRPEGICEGEHLNFILTWKWAALMRLHQIQEGYEKKHPRVKECLANILCSIRAIGENSPLECGLVFPLIMAGAAASSSCDQEYIVHRVQCLKSQLGFGYVDQVDKLLQTIWTREEKTKKPVNWASVRYYEFSGIVMI